MVYKAKNISKKIIKLIFIFVIALLILSNSKVKAANSTTIYLDGAKNNNFITLTYDKGFTNVPNIKINEEMLNRQNNVFCMNQGQNFYGTRKCYEQIYFSINGQTVNYYLDGKSYDYDKVDFEETYNKKSEFRNFMSDFHEGRDITNLFSTTSRLKLAYILSEIPKEIQMSKNNRTDSIYQQAIWKLQNDKYSINYKESDTKKLLANAAAYDYYVKNNRVGNTPNIDVANSIVTTDNKLQVPISNYKVYTNSDGGTYGEITKVQILNATNGNVLLTDTKPEISNNKLIIDLTENFMSQNPEIKVKVFINNKVRNAYLWILRCNGQETQERTIWKSEMFWKELQTEITTEEGINTCPTCKGKLDLVTYDYFCEFCDKSTVTNTALYEVVCLGCNKTRHMNYKPSTNPCCGAGYDFEIKKIRDATNDVCDCYLYSSTGTLISYRPSRWKEYMACFSCKRYYKLTVSSTHFKADGDMFTIDKKEDGTINEITHYCETITGIDEQGNEYTDKQGVGLTKLKSWTNVMCPICSSGQKSYSKNEHFSHWESAIIMTGTDCETCKRIFNRRGDSGGFFVPEGFIECSQGHCFPCGDLILVDGTISPQTNATTNKVFINYEKDSIVIKENEYVATTDNFSNRLWICRSMGGCTKVFAFSDGEQVKRVWCISKLNDLGASLKANGVLYNGSTYLTVKQIGISEENTSTTTSGTSSVNSWQNLIVGGGSGSVAETEANPDSVPDLPPIQLNPNLTINKTNAATKLPMKDVDLDFEITGVKSVIVGDKTYSASNGTVKITNVITDSSGNIKLKNIEFSGSEAYVTITENINNTKYLAWSEPLKLKLTKSNGGLKVTKVSGPDYLSLDNLHVNYKEYGYWYHTGSIKNGKDAVVNITNIPLINISGIVYLDGQTGVKDVQTPNGQKDLEEYGIDGIKVDLKDVNDNSINSIHTNNDGLYTFTGILAQPYYITYEYNGMKYESSINQTAFEERRSNFNETFGTFTNTTSKNAKDEKTNELLENQYTVMTARTKTVSIHDIDKNSSKFTNEPENIQLGFVSGPGKTEQNPTILSVIEAASGVTGNYTNVNKTNSPKTDITFNDGHLTINHSYGLLKREADLALGVKVDSITVSANGKTSTEKFGTSNAEKDVDLSENRTIEYNKALAEIDYNFTMTNYKEDWKVGEANPTTESVPFEQTTMDITYLVEIKNVCARDANVGQIYFKENSNLKVAEKVKEIKYYYSNNLTPTVIEKDSNNEDAFDISDFGNIPAGQSMYIEITYRVDRNLIEENKEFALEAEIGTYSTQGVKMSENWTTQGCMVDKDSTPSNWNTNEDDYGKATVKLIKDETAERTISGVVFEDAKTEGPNEYKVGNGNWDAGENKLNGIVVQLIELKEVELLGTTYSLEYLWQETVTGSNVVKRINDTGTEITTYTHAGDIATGQYLFKDVLPGTYVVRFRYGEDYEDEYVNVAGGAVELEKYNGINYKSTTDKFYQEEWYKKSNYRDISSVARDIEAKRLELMSKTVSVSDAVSDKGMVAETSKINVSQSTNNLESTDKVVSYDSTEKTKMEFNTINFGLEERPATKIDLEKHVTQIEIINGRNVLLNYEKGRESQNLQVSDVATKTERGMLYFAIDFEVLRGANMKMKYTYSIKNISETDYLSKELIKAYKEKTTEEYKAYLQTLAKGIKNKDISVVEDYTIGKYLGNTYYTGEVDTNTVEKVPLKVTGLRDYLDNRFKYISGGDFETASANGKVSYVLKNPNAANGVTVIYEAKSGLVKNAIESTNLAAILEIESSPITRSAVVEKIEGIDQEKDLMFIGYNAEITDYTIPTGRIGGSNQQPGNINYAYTEEDLEGPKEDDESWAETLVISKPTGIANTELTNNTKIIIISATAIVIIAAGIFAIKKFVIK